MRQGKPYPLSPTLSDDGGNFSIFSAHGKAIQRSKGTALASNNALVKQETTAGPAIVGAR